MLAPNNAFTPARDGVDGPGRHGDDQAALRSGHVEVGADLGAVVLKGLGRGVYVALPVDHDLGRAVRIEGDGVDDPCRRFLVAVALG